MLFIGINYRVRKIALLLLLARSFANRREQQQALMRAGRDRDQCIRYVDESCLEATFAADAEDKKRLEEAIAKMQQEDAVAKAALANRKQTKETGTDILNEQNK